MGGFPAGLFDGQTLERLVVKLLASLAADESAVRVIACDQTDTGGGGGVKLASLVFIANVGFTGGATDESQTDCEGRSRRISVLSFL